MTDNDITSIELINDEYPLTVVNSNDIINSIKFDSEEEKLLCEAIITDLEKTAAEEIKNMKCVSIPLIGALRINPIQKEIKDNNASLYFARKHMNKEEYKEHVRSYIEDIKERTKIKDREKKLLVVAKRNNKKKYEKLYKLFGRNYAELYLYSFLWFSVVDYDAEFEEVYANLKD